jgi:enoyl-CoA hydratase
MQESKIKEEVIFEINGIAGIITLNRPQALNALNLNMVRLIRTQLDAWAIDSAIERVIIKGAGGKAFCAGGDIRTLHDQGKAGQHADALTFWREEYDLNILIKNYKKPYISLIDGIVMGGGVGLSINGEYVIGGERFMFAMPEVGIGFFPDVGGTYFLPRMPFKSGLYAALTGNRFKQGDAKATGLITHAVTNAERCEAILCEKGDIETQLKPFLVQVDSPLLAHKGTINSCFTGKSLDDIYKNLERDARATDAYAADILKTMRAKSPTSQMIAFEQVKRGASLTFEQAMALEFRIVSKICHGQDFYEGVRAVIIDKDNAPVWAAIPADVSAYFEEG